MRLRNTKQSLRNLIIITIVAVLAVGIFFAAYYGFGTNTVSRDLTVQEAQTLVDGSISKMPRETADGAKYIFNSMQVKVLSVNDGDGKSLDFECEYTACDVNNTLTPNLNGMFTSIYDKYLERKNSGMLTSGTYVSLIVKDTIVELLTESNATVTGNITISAFEVNDGEFQIFFDRETVNTITGGLEDFKDKVQATEVIDYKGEEINIKSLTTLRNGIEQSISYNDTYSEKPYTGTAVKKAVEKFKSDFYKNFIKDDRWVYLVSGLGTTLALTGLSVLLGVIIGFLVSIVRVTFQTTGKLKILDALCRLYLTLFRGTPLMVQLLIIYFIILLPIGIPKFIAAVLCFGFNSGAYVAEIVRGGIMSVDKGQMEAGRSLGFNYSQTMFYFIMPQAFKAVLPALANEFITLLKESSVAFYLGVADLTQGGLKIRSLSFSNFMPLVAVALIYLILVLILTWLVSLLERRLRKSER